MLCVIKITIAETLGLETLRNIIPKFIINLLRPTKTTSNYN